MSTCPDCGGTGFTLDMEPCEHHIPVIEAVVPEGFPPPPFGMRPMPIDAPTEDYTVLGAVETPAPAPAALPETPPVYKGKGKPATEKQINFLRTLIAERDETNAFVIEAKTYFALPLSARAASTLIEDLKKYVPVTKPTVAVRKNRYDGTCATCGTPVPAEAGRIEKNEHGKWITFHLTGGCPEGDDLAAAKADMVTEPGIYRKAGAFYRVKFGRDKRTLWADRIHVTEPDDPHAGTYVKGIVFIKSGRATFLRASDKITLTEARDFGVAVGACINCGYTLDGEDGKSVVAGYGATCAKNLGWLYPSTADMKAINAGVVTWDELLAAGR